MHDPLRVTIAHPSFRYDHNSGCIVALDEDGDDMLMTFAPETALVFARELADIAAKHVSPISLLANQS
jgi:hypothetical protein